VFDGLICAIAHYNLQKRALAGKPRLGIEQLQMQQTRFLSYSRCARRRRLFLLRGQRQSKFAGTNLFNHAVMLLLDADSQRLFPLRVERQQIMKTVGTPMQDLPAKIDRRIDEPVSWSALFRLDVVSRAGDSHVGVVPECHFRLRSGGRQGWSDPRGNLYGLLFAPANLTERLVNRYYTKLPMRDSGLHTYAPLLLHLLIAMLLAGALTAVSVLVGWRRPTRAKQQAYECGMEPTGDAREPFSVKFYLVAMVFILFDVEAIFLYPWAYIFRSLRWYGFVEMMIYIAVLLVGYLYLWKKGALDWHK